MLFLCLCGNSAVLQTGALHCIHVPQRDARPGCVGLFLETGGDTGAAVPFPGVRVGLLQ